MDTIQARRASPDGPLRSGTTCARSARASTDICARPSKSGERAARKTLRGDEGKGSTPCRKSGSGRSRKGGSTL